jgi:hypothetical protein
MAAKLKIEKKGDEIKKKSSPLKLVSQSQPNFSEMILGWSPFKNVSVSAVLYPILVGSRDHRTQFWKGAIQGSFHKSLVAIGPVVSEEKFLCEFPIRSYVKLSSAKSSLLKLLSQSQPNFAEMILGWSSSKIVSGISDKSCFPLII